MREATLMQIGLLGLVLGATTILKGCSINEVSHCRSLSPDGKNEVIVWRLPHGADDSVKITITSDGRRQTIYEDREDRWPRKCQAWWAQDSRAVTIVVCDALGEGIAIVHDTVAGKRLSDKAATPYLKAIAKEKFSACDTATGKGILRCACN